MSAALLFDSVTRIARHEAAARPVASAGVVTSVFPNEGGQPDHAVTVKLRESGLVLPRVPVAVGAPGFAAIPAVDDLVVVAFLEGDFHSPVVVGRLYHPDQDPPKHKTGEIVLRLPSGDSDPKFQCVITGDPANLLLTLPGDVKVEIVEEKITLAAGDMQVVLDGGGSVKVSTPDASISLKKNGDMALKSSKSLKLESNEVEIKASSKVKIQGAMVEIN